MTTTEGKILAEYARAHKLRPQLSKPALGQYHFTDTAGERVIVSMTTMKKYYEDTKEQIRKAKKAK